MLPSPPPSSWESGKRLPFSEAARCRLFHELPLTIQTVAPLRCAPVGMTILVGNGRSRSQQVCLGTAGLVPNQNCHPDRSAAQWSDLLFFPPLSDAQWKRNPPLCHPDRSGGICGSADPFVEMFWAVPRISVRLCRVGLGLLLVVALSAKQLGEEPLFLLLLLVGRRRGRSRLGCGCRGLRTDRRRRQRRHPVHRGSGATVVCLPMPKSFWNRLR